MVLYHLQIPGMNSGIWNRFTESQTCLAWIIGTRSGWIPVPRVSFSFWQAECKCCKRAMQHDATCIIIAYRAQSGPTYATSGWPISGTLRKSATSSDWESVALVQMVPYWRKCHKMPLHILHFAGKAVPLQRHRHRHGRAMPAVVELLFSCLTNSWVWLPVASSISCLPHWIDVWSILIGCFLNPIRLLLEDEEAIVALQGWPPARSGSCSKYLLERKGRLCHPRCLDMLGIVCSFEQCSEF